MEERTKAGTHNERLLTPDQVADLLTVPVSWIYGRKHLGSLPFPHIKVGAYLRFREADILRFIETHRSEQVPA